VSYWAEKRVPSMSTDELARVPDDIPRWKVAYWQFQFAMTERYILPFLHETGAVPGEGRVLEVGAGEGGCLAALSDATRLPADGLELSAPRAELGTRLNEALGRDRMRIAVGDISDPACLSKLSPPYTLMLLRDVIEHVEAFDAALDNCARLLAPGGVLLFVFPPYLSPFGAHQQILSRAVLRLPWLQLLPGFLGLVRRLEPVPGKREEIEGLSRCRLTIAKMESALKNVPFDRHATRHYLLRPVFRYRYGLPVISASVLGRMPGLRELVVTGSWYLLRRRDGA